MSTNNIEIQDHLGNSYYPKTVSSQVEMEDGRFLSNYNVSTTQKGFMSAEDKVKLDNISKEMIDVYEEVSSTGSATVNDSVAGTIQDIEILGNTYQNPSNLAEIKSVGKLRDDGLYEVNVKSYGKNIFNLLSEELVLSGSQCTFEIINSNSIKITKSTANAFYTITKKLKPNTLYSLSAIRKNNTKESLIGLANSSQGLSDTRQTTTNSDGILKINLRATAPLESGTEIFENIQVEEGNSTSFEPYKDTVATIKLPCQLEGIGDIKDRFYFDKQQGKWFIEKKIGEVILDGSQTITESNLVSNYIQSNITFNDHLLSDYRGISDKFKCIQYCSGENECFAMHHYGLIIIKLLQSKVETLDKAGVKKWLTSNNVKVKYITKTPQLIELPLDTQIILNSFDSITHKELDSGEIQGTIKCKVSKSLKSSVNSLVEKTDSLDNRVKQIEGLKESQSLAYQSPKGSLVCTDTKNGVIEDLKISGRTLVNHINAIDSGLVTQHGATAQKLIDEQCYKITFTSTEWSGCKRIPCFTLDPNKTYTLVIDVLENTCTNQIDMAHKLYDPAMFRGDYLIEPRWTGRCRLIKYTGRSSLAPATYVYQSGASGYVKARYMVLEGDYTGANSNLIPEYFEGIKSVGQDINKIEILSRGKNLFNIGGNINQKYNNMNGNLDNELLSDGGIKLNNYSHAHHGSGQKIKVKSNTTYTVRGRISGDVTASVHSSSKNYLYIWHKISNPFTFTFNSGDNREVCLAFTTWGDSSKTKAIVYDIMVVEGNQQLPYEKEYHETIKPLFYYDTNGDIVTIPELREWDTIEKHSDGKYYYHKVSGEITLTGDENWTVGLTGTPNFYYELPVTLTSKTGGDKVICNTLPYSGIGSSTTAMGISTTQDGRLRIRLNSEIPLADFKQWLKTNSTTVVFKAPQEEVYECVDLTLSSYEGMTNIQAISGAIKPSIEFKISSHINNVVLSNRDRINQLNELLLEAKLQIAEMEIQMLEGGIN